MNVHREQTSKQTSKQTNKQANKPPQVHSRADDWNKVKGSGSRAVLRAAGALSSEGSDGQDSIDLMVRLWEGFEPRRMLAFRPRAGFVRCSCPPL
jgi:hypothetical protein